MTKRRRISLLASIALPAYTSVVPRYILGLKAGLFRVGGDCDGDTNQRRRRRCRRHSLANITYPYAHVQYM